MVIGFLIEVILFFLVYFLVVSFGKYLRCFIVFILGYVLGCYFRIIKFL